MTSAIRSTLSLLLVGAALSPPTPLLAQDSGITIDFGAAAINNATIAVPDSVVERALELFNGPATSRYFGGSQLRSVVGGTVGAYNAALLISGQVQGSVVVINGNLRLEPSAHIDGDIIVIGGRLTPDSGSTWSGTVSEYRGTVPLRLNSRALLERSTAAPSIGDITQRLTLQVGEVEITPRLKPGVYNRVEGLPIGVGPTLSWNDGRELFVRGDAELILRSASDPSGIRSRTGMWARLSATREGQQPLSVAFEYSDRIVPTADAVLSNTESSLNALLFRRDYRDWFAVKGFGALVEWNVFSTLSTGVRISRLRHRSVPSASPFSILREGNPWRSNPLMDDGKYTTISLGAKLATAEEDEARSQGWRINGSVTRTSGEEVSQALLPELIRDPLPASGYQSWEASLDLRRVQRLDPRNAIHLRVAAEGWLGGDPLTVQRRRALNGAEPFPGYSFRSVACDLRRRPDPAAPALCDRRIMIQAEFRRTVDLNLGTRVGPYGLGIDRADLILFSDFGSAWLAGDGPGQVPTNRIQSMSEWRGDVGVGVDAGWFGTYLAKSFTDNEPLRLSFRLQQRF